MCWDIEAIGQVYNTAIGYKLSKRPLHYVARNTNQRGERPATTAHLQMAAVVELAHELMPHGSSLPGERDVLLGVAREHADAWLV